MRKWEGTTEQGIQRGRRGRKREGSEEEDKDVDEAVSAVLLVSSKAFKAPFFSFSDKIWYGHFKERRVPSSLFLPVPCFF